MSQKQLDVLHIFCAIIAGVISVLMGHAYYFA